MNIRPATPSDVAALHALILELAEFEKISHWVEATEDSTRDALFGNSPSAEALVAEVKERIVGVAVFFENYSTFVGRPGLYLEDIYVQESFRSQGIGHAFLRELARIARDREHGRMEWTVLDWNQRAIDFYESLGAEVLPDWRVVRLGRDGIRSLSEEISQP